MWRTERPAWIDVGQEALSAAAPLLARAREPFPQMGHVRIVPDGFGFERRASAVATDAGVTVFVGPGSVRGGPDPVAVAREAMHVVVDPLVRGQACPSLHAVYTAAASYPAVEAEAPSPDRWLAASLVRALVLDTHMLEGDAATEAVRDWVEEGWLLVPTILEGLERANWEVWLEEQCAVEDDPVGMPPVLGEDEAVDPAP